MKKISKRTSSRIGLALRNFEMRAEEFAGLAKRAEGRGFESIWLTESFARDTLVTYGMLAGKTRRIGLATGVLNIFTRTPLATAMSIATIDELSGGRAILGLGTGDRNIVSRGFGVRFEKPLSRMEEYVKIVRGFLAGETVTYGGHFFNIENFRMGFKPTRSVPIYLSALGPLMMKAAGRIADGIILSMMPMGYLKKALDTVKVAAKDAGRDPRKIDIALFLPAYTLKDLSVGRSLLKRVLATYIGSFPAFATMLDRVGFHDYVERVMNLWNSGNKADAAQVIPDEMIDEVAFVGPPSEVENRVEEYRKHGVTLPILYPNPVGFPTDRSIKNIVRIIEHTS